MDEKDAASTTEAVYCDCERGHNGIGLAGRLCDCQEDVVSGPAHAPTTGMRLAVTGGRYYKDADAVARALDKVHSQRGIALLIHGACPVGHGGADMLADAWAKANGVPVLPFPVDHAVDGPWPGAGPRRNRRMIRDGKPDGVVAFPGGRGTRDMIEASDEADLKVWEPTK